MGTPHSSWYLLEIEALAQFQKFNNTLRVSKRSKKFCLNITESGLLHHRKDGFLVSWKISTVLSDVVKWERKFIESRNDDRRGGNGRSFASLVKVKNNRQLFHNNRFLTVRSTSMQLSVLRETRPSTFATLRYPVFYYHLFLLQLFLQLH